MSVSAPAAHGVRAIQRAIRAAAIAALLLGSMPALAASESRLNVAVLDNTSDRIVVRYDLQGFDQGSATIDGRKYSRVRLAHEPQLMIAGAPDLPHVPRSIIIPDSAAMAVRVTDASFYDLPDIDLLPSKGHLLRSVNPADVPYAFGPAYAGDAFFPGDLASLGTPYILRDHRGVVVDVRPFQYNPVRRTLRVYTSLTVEAAPVATDSVNVLVRKRAADEPSLAFHTLYGRQFINYQPRLRYAPLDETGDMLIIAYDPWLPNVQPLADHKTARGIHTTVVGVSTIGNDAASIKNYISSVYATSNLAFVLLVGDAEQVAPPFASGGAADAVYSKLAGNDDYPEIMVGRFSAETAAQADTQVQRSIAYENGFAPGQTWFWRATGIGSAEGPGDNGEYDYQHIAHIRSDLLADGYTTVDEIYDPGATAAQVFTALNAGRGLVNYTGHGSVDGWTTTGFSSSSVEALVNDNRLPFIVTVACLNGQFDGRTCFAEAWLRATHGAAPTGAVGIYASAISQWWEPPMAAQDEIVDLYCAETYVALGTLCFAGSCGMMDKYGTYGVEMFDTWILFGDPSLQVVAAAAAMQVLPRDGLYVQGGARGPFTPDSITYTVENRSTQPMVYEVTKSASWLTITGGAGTIPASGSAAVTITVNSYANYLGDGLYQATVSFTDLTSHSGDTTRLVQLKVGVPALQYEWNMDVNPGWSTQGQWAWGQPTGRGGAYGYPDPTSGHTGQYVYGYNLNGDYANGIPEYHLTTSAIDCTNIYEVSLRFWRWLGVEGTGPLFDQDHAQLRVSTNGTVWTMIWANPEVWTTDANWTYQQFDILALADNQPTVYVRWTMGPTDLSWTFCGWNIDDVQIWGRRPSLLRPGDVDCSGAIDFDDINPFVQALLGRKEYEAAHPDCHWMNGDVNGDLEVDFDDINPFVALLGR